MTLKSAVVGDPGSSPRGRGKLHRRRDLIPNRRLIPAWAGKTMADRSATSSHPGSSPRGRGKHADELAGYAPGGLIPAWAGKTYGSSMRPRAKAAHPRVGGENSTPPATDSRQFGSSPRGRGKRYSKVVEFTQSGLIPAWAGKTFRAMPRPGWTRGSSPRGRGKPPDLKTASIAPGLIPAWAGKTPACSCNRRSAQAHPRVGGENSRRASSAAEGAGSSPRGRGKRHPVVQVQAGVRLIPAWAGKTTRGSSWPQQRGAHPRVGGENDEYAPPPLALDGSSPRGRGKQPRAYMQKLVVRLIPAWAGKTATVFHAIAFVAAHPRVGGENVMSPSKNCAHSGSSPRGRGKRSPPVHHAVFLGLIPAWAGKTAPRPTHET